MRTIIAEFATPEAQRTARHLGRLVREARLARGMPQSELAVRARTSPATVVRMEKGSLETALGIWLQVMEVLGLLQHLNAIEDPATLALLDQHKPQRARRRAAPDLDF